MFSAHQRDEWNGRIGCTPHNRNAEKRECDARPLPTMCVERLDELRARERWQHRHYPPNDDDEHDEADDDDIGDTAA